MTDDDNGGGAAGAAGAVGGTLSTPCGEVNIVADYVMLCAGSMGSTEILLRSKANGLRVSDQVGKHFGGWYHM